MNREVSVQEADFDAGVEIAALSAGDASAGAVASFVGLVRGGEVSAMTLEHYAGMTEEALGEIDGQARARWMSSDQRLSNTSCAQRAAAGLETTAPNWSRESARHMVRMA